MSQRIQTGDGWAEVRSNRVVVHVASHVSRPRGVTTATFTVRDGRLADGGWAQFSEPARKLAQAALREAGQ